MAKICLLWQHFCYWNTCLWRHIFYLWQLPPTIDLRQRKMQQHGAESTAGLFRQMFWGLEKCLEVNDLKQSEKGEGEGNSKLTEGWKTEKARAWTSWVEMKPFTAMTDVTDLKTANKSFKFESLKPFCFPLRMARIFIKMHNTEIRFVQYKTGKYSVCRAWMCTLQRPGNFTDWGTEGVHGSQGLGLEPNKDLITYIRTCKDQY